MNADELQLIKTWLLVRCNCNIQAWWSGVIVLTSLLAHHCGSEAKQLYTGICIYLLIQSHNYRCACKSVATDSNISAGEIQT